MLTFVFKFLHMLACFKMVLRHSYATTIHLIWIYNIYVYYKCCLFISKWAFEELTLHPAEQYIILKKSDSWISICESTVLYSPLYACIYKTRALSWQYARLFENLWAVKWLFCYLRYIFYYFFSIYQMFVCFFLWSY